VRSIINPVTRESNAGGGGAAVTESKRRLSTPAADIPQSAGTGSQALLGRE